MLRDLLRDRDGMVKSSSGPHLRGQSIALGMKYLGNNPVTVREAFRWLNAPSARDFGWGAAYLEIGLPPHIYKEL